MIERVSNDNTIIHCHIIAHNLESDFYLAVGKDRGETYVCILDTMSDDVSYVVLQNVDKNIEWNFLK